MKDPVEITYQDLRMTLKPGTLVYPMRRVSSRLGYHCGHLYDNFFPGLPGLNNMQFVLIGISDKNLRFLLKDQSVKQKKFPCAKVYYPEPDSLFLARVSNEDWVDVEITYPNPIGIYLGEIISVKLSRIERVFYSKILTVYGDIVWI